MKHKILAMFLASVLTAGLLTGCGEDSTKENTGAKTEASEGSSSVDEETAAKAVDEEEAMAAGFTDGEDGTEETGTEQSGDAASDTETFDTEEDSETAAVLSTDTELSGKHHAEIVIRDYGEIDVELDADTAPITVTNFVKLAQEGFYDGLTFHRIMDGFMMRRSSRQWNRWCRGND